MPANDLGEIAVEIIELRIELSVSEAHGGGSDGGGFAEFNIVASAPAWSILHASRPHTSSQFPAWSFGMTNRTSRRTFVRGLFAAGAVASFPAVSWARVAGANERLRVASIGPGVKGWSDLTRRGGEPAVEVVALCDIDSSAMHLGRAAEKYAQPRPSAIGGSCSTKESRSTP